MTTSQKHIIHRAQVDISSAAWLDTRATQQWVQGKLLEILDEVLNEVSNDSISQVVDNLHIECHLHSMQEITAASTRQQIRLQVELALKQAVTDGPLSKGQQNHSQQAVHGLLMYLRFGSIANKRLIAKWKQDNSEHQALSAMAGTDGHELLKTLQFPDALHRFRQLFTDNHRFEGTVLALLASYAPHQITLQHWFQEASSGAIFRSDKDRLQILQRLIKCGFLPAEEAANFLDEALVEIGLEKPDWHYEFSKGSNRENEMPVAAASDKAAFVERNNAGAMEKSPAPAFEGYDQLYAANAGVILLAPFLPRFFQQLHIDPAQNESAAQQASLLVHYLATGDTHPFDWELALPKLLCAYPFEMVIHPGIELAEGWKTEADQLLLAIITHWSKLGNTSIATLRQSFLQREGQLIFKETGTILKIPERTEDILLQFIPWSFRMIKLPWMKQLLETEWT